MPITEAVLSQIIGLASDAIIARYRSRNREDYGEFTIRDKSSDSWEVKVRSQSSRGRYLKLKRVSNEKLKLRASADSYKLYDKYLPITEEEWIAFAEYYQSRDSRLLTYLEDVLARLIPKAHMID